MKISSILFLTLLGALSGQGRAAVPPVYGGPNLVYAYENAPNGTILTTFNVSDLENQYPVTVLVDDSSKDLVFLRLERNGTINVTMSVILKEQLDRDFSPPRRMINLKAQTNHDANAINYIGIQLFIRDVNDVPPQFQNLPYSVTVREDTVNGTTLLDNILTTDPDEGTGANVYYTLQGTGTSTFSLVPNLSGHNASIVLSGDLDYESVNTYVLTLVATDGGGLNSITDVVIRVRDVQDTPPYFSNLPYLASIPERSAISTTVLHVTALDGDRGNPNIVTYTIDHDSCGAAFAVDTNTGAVTLRQLLDRDNGTVADNEGQCLVTIRATEVDPNPPNGIRGTNTANLTVTVTDVNDNSPQFNQQYFSISVAENTQGGVPLSFNGTAMSAFDRDQGSNAEFNLTLLDLAEFFEPRPSRVLSSSSVVIYVTNGSILDYERHQTLVFRIEAKETNTEEHWQNTATVTITVVNQNDMNPTFNQSIFNATLPENSPNGTPVITVKAWDLDRGSYGSVTHTIRDNSNAFQIDPSSGLITVKDESKLDREVKATYYVTVVAVDGGGSMQAVPVEITLSDKNDNPPRFLASKYLGQVNEGNVTFTSNVTVKAEDADEAGNPNSIVRYNLTHVPSEVSGMFHIDPNSGQLTLNQVLDYEALPSAWNGVVDLEVTAWDQGTPAQSASVSVTVRVEDINENAPQFVPAAYSTQIYENATRGSHVLTVSASDADGSSPNKDFFFLLQGGAEGKFILDSTSGHLTLASPLDRETATLYMLTVQAVDRGTPSMTSSATVNVTVLDVNDTPPSFSVRVRSVDVAENTRVNAFVAAFPATDPDLNSDLVYSIDWDTANVVYAVSPPPSTPRHWLAVDGGGNVTVAEPLDRETVQQLTVTVKVEDRNATNLSSQTDTATLTVRVTDVNDQAPLFQENAYTARVPENAAPGLALSLTGSSVQILAQDKDQPPNNNFSVSVMPSHGGATFNVTPATVRGSAPLVLSVVNNSALDFETTKEINITLLAVDQGSNLLNSTVVVKVLLTDENDHDPTFTESVYNGTIAENSPLGTSVVLVKANDEDTGSFASVTYALPGGGTEFKINASSGLITVGATVLDRETKATYSLTVEATDGGGRRGTATVSIRLDDVNDNDPVFRSDYSTLVTENTRDLRPRITVQADDSDSGNNSAIHYSFAPGYMSGNFTINPTSGEITLNSPLDYELLNPGSDGVVVLNLLAVDQGSPHRTGTASLTVSVLDANDFTPEFSQSVITTRVSEGAASGHHVARVTATDRDGTSPNNDMFYLIQSGSGGKFTVNGSTGEITVDGSLDRETTPAYVITVVVSDRGNPPLSSSMTVNILIDDVNDVAPTFNHTVSSANVPEDARNGRHIFSFSATDPDLNHSLQYRIDWASSRAVGANQEPADIALVKNWFSIDAVTGEVRVSGSLDRESIQEVTLSITVNDTNGQATLPQTDSGSLTITIEDVNDNHPEFNTAVFQASVAENTQSGIPISFVGGTQMVVSDADTSRQNSLFSLSLVDHVADFEVVPPQVQSSASVLIRVKNPAILDYESIQNITLKVVAMEVNSTQSSTATVHVAILDMNDNSPQFVQTNYDASVIEAGKPGAFVTLVTASDQDSGDYGQIQYTLQGGDGIFHIDPNTGNVTANASAIDRELTTSYSLTVTATDGGNRSTTVRLTVSVSDVNDKVPRFQREQYDASLVEGTHAFSRPLQLQASDDDERGSPNSDISFTIVDVRPSSLWRNFTIDNSSGVITPTGDLDFEGVGQGFLGQVNVTVMAKDHGTPPLNSTTVVMVTVEDKNDNRPIFSKSQYNISIAEDHPINEEVMTLFATDRDGSPPNNQLFYLLQAGAGDQFRVDSDTGRLWSAAGLDRERQANYTLTVLAVDRGTPPLNASATVMVTIIDVNDEKPRFDRNDVTVNVLENSTLYSELFKFEARDGDLNSSLQYQLLSNESFAYDAEQNELNQTTLQHYFHLSSTTGGINLRNPLSSDAISRAILVISVKDRNEQTNTPQTATATLTINIIDVNDHPPNFGVSHYVAEIEENSQPGTPIQFVSPADMNVADRDRDKNAVFQVTLLDHGDTLEVVPATVRSSASLLVRVKNGSILDYETLKNFTVRVVARETMTSERRSSTATLTINITDANDHVPEFSEPEYHFNLTENSPAGFLVGSVSASDKDSGNFGNVTYSLQGGQNLFEVDAMSGRVRVLTNTTDRESRDTYAMTVVARDGGGRSNATQVTVTLQDQNDNAPIFIRTDYLAVIKEGSTAFQRPLVLQARDSDEPGTLNSKVVYSLKTLPDKINQNFTIDHDTGMMSPIGVLDYEALSADARENGTILLTAIATDRGTPNKSSEVIITISVEDANDNKPEFNASQYHCSLPENAPINTTAIYVFATDRDGSPPNNQLFYLLQAGAGDQFRVDSDTGRLWSAAGLDRERQANYTLTVLAVDRGTPPLTASATVMVTITDVNDAKPFFERNDVTKNVPESWPLRDMLYNFSAVDGDANADLVYEVVWNSSSALDADQNPMNTSLVQSYFAVNNSSGIISLKRALNAEFISRAILVVRVQDLHAAAGTQQTATGTLTLVVEDVNDHAPEFNSPVYNASVLENSLEGIPVTLVSPLQMSVTDRDRDKNSIFQLSLLNCSEYFTVEPETVRSSALVQLKVKNSSLLDYETLHSLHIMIQARETQTTERLSGNASIFLSIEDVNDNLPEFNSTSYAATVYENSPNATSVLQVFASDLDSGNFGTLRFSLQGDQSTFGVNERTGEVMVTGSVDRESRTAYSLVVAARDGGGLTTTASVTVTVLDVNDKHPVFSRNDYEGVIVEGRLDFSRSVRVESTDGDQLGTNNSAVRYKLLSASQNLFQNFSVNSSTGEVAVRGPLDYEALALVKGRLELLVEAYDLGQPVLTSNTTVIVTVEDFNDNAPIFNQTSYIAHVQENSVPGTNVTQVFAEDADGEAPNNALFYIIDSGGSDKFKMDGATGQVSVERGAKVDRELDSNFTLVVLAIDRGSPSLTGAATLTIYVDDVNDEPPRFQPNDVTVRVMEDATIGGVLHAFSAVDGDEDARLNYTVLWHASSGYDVDQNLMNVSTLQSYFSLDQTTGSIKLETKLDADVISRATLVVRVEDLNAGLGTHQTATGTLTLVVEDVNNHAPEFNSHVYTASVLENSLEGFPVTLVSPLQMSVTDKDRDRNSIFELRLLNYTDYFSVEPVRVRSSSLVQIKVKNSTFLDYERLAPLHSLSLQILARETLTNSPRSNTAEIHLTVKDVNDNYPEFLNLSYSASIPEDHGSSRPIVNITATDRDSGIFAHITYSIQGDQTVFRIDNETGLLYVSSHLDFESRKSYNIIVAARDGGGLTTTASVAVTVLDVNDEYPVFSRNDYEGVIVEGRLNFSRPVRVEAKDGDQPGTNNSEVRYRKLSASQNLLQNFSVDSSTGEVAVRGPLDYEALALVKGRLELLVEAYDLGQPVLTSNTTVIVTVEDYNDNKPVFNASFYTAHVTENALEGTNVTQVFAEDADGEAPNNALFYIIDSGGSDKFKMDGATGQVSVERGAKVDRELDSSFTLKVLAIDRGSPPLTGTATLTIYVDDVNDEPPRFNVTNQYVEILENATVDSEVLVFSAHDPDRNPRLNYSIDWNLSSASSERNFKVNTSRVEPWFGVDADTGVVRVKSKLDRETAETVVLVLQVRDMAAAGGDLQTATGTLTIRLGDVNDNEPEFEGGATLTLNVSESTPSGSELTTVLALDRDLNQNVQYSLSNNSTFAIGPSDGKLRLAAKLDREKVPSIAFLILATDSGQPPLTSNLTVHVNVLDANDNDPIFHMPNTPFLVSEDADNTTLVAVVNATDNDADDNANVTFYFNNDVTGKFRINATSGEIFVDGPLDRETTPTYNLEVTAHDNPLDEERRRARYTVIVDVTDVNDNDPVFSHSEYSTSVVESWPVNDSISVSPPILATDRDLGENATVRYSLAESNQSHLFTIDPESGQLRINSSLLGLADKYQVTVIARDMGPGSRESNASLLVRVVDENLNHPAFVVAGPVPDIPECALKGSSIYKFEATDEDRDKQTNGRISYSLKASADANAFRIDPETGELRTDEEFNREEKQDYKIEVVATDHGLPSNFSTSIPVTINLKDVNDNPPSFNSSADPYLFHVMEETTTSDIGNVTATDPDEDSKVCYHLMDGPYRDYFNITYYGGQLIVEKPLDRETVVNITLTVSAEDCSDVSIFTVCRATAFQHHKPVLTTVTVTVDDVNDNPPRFISNIRVGVVHSTLADTEIVKLEEYVQDADVGINRVHEYSLAGKVEGSPGLNWDEGKNPRPVVLAPNGTVITGMSYSNNMVGYFSLPVLVNDSAGNDTALLKVYVIGDEQRFRITFFHSPEEVKRFQKELLELLRRETGDKYEFVADEIRARTTAEREILGYQADLFFHVVEAKGDVDEILTADDIEKVMDRLFSRKPDILSTYKVIETDKALASKLSSSSVPVQFLLIGVVVLLAIVLLILALFYYRSVRRYQRKVRAANIKTEGVSSGAPHQNGYVNAAVNQNPVFELDIPPEDEVDAASERDYDSIDDNEVHRVGKQEEDEQEMVLQLQDEEVKSRPLSSNSDAALGFLNAALEEHDEDRRASGEPPAPKPSVVLNMNGFHHLNRDELESSDI